MRLIDADKVIEHLEKVRKDNPYFVNTTYIRGMQEVIKEQPTVYDIGKVVEQLKTDSSAKLYGGGNGNNYLIPVERAINIIKAGNDTQNNPRKEAYLKALKDYHDSVQDSCMRWASAFRRRNADIPWTIEKINNTIFKMLKVGASEIE